MEEKWTRVAIHDPHGNIVADRPLSPEGAAEQVTQHNADQEAHPYIKEAITGIRTQVVRRLVGAKVTFNDGHTEDVELGFNDQGEVILLLPKETFGKIDGVKVNGEELPVDANGKVDITMPTTVAELSDAEDYATKEYTDARTIGNVTATVEVGGEVKQATVTKDGSDVQIDFPDLKGDKGDPLTWDDLTESQKASLKGDPGDNCYVGQGDLPLAQVVSQATDKAITPKGVADAVNSVKDDMATYSQASLSYTDELCISTSGDTRTIVTTTMQKMYYLPVDAGDCFRAIGTAASSSAKIRYGFLSAEPVEGAEVTGVTEFSATINTYINVEATGYLAISCPKNEFTNLKITKRSEPMVHDLAEKVAALPTAEDISALLLEDIDNARIPAVPYAFVDGTTFSTNSNQKHAVISVQYGERYVIGFNASAQNSATLVIFATSDAYSSGGAIPILQGTSQMSVTYEDVEKVFTIPQGCKFLLIYNGGNVTTFKVKRAYTNAISRKKTISPKLSYESISSASGRISSDDNVEKINTIVTTPRLIAVNGDFTLASSIGGRVVVYLYKADYSYLGSVTYNDVQADTPFNVTVGLNSKFAKIALSSGTTPLVDLEGMPTITLTGDFPERWDVYNAKPANGVQKIRARVRVTDPHCCDDDTSDIQDKGMFNSELNKYLEYWSDYGFIYLPEAYDNIGEPTRLIIYCHGAAVNYGDADTGFVLADIDPGYWLAEGYAVMDMEGNPFNNENEHILMPQAMDCYVAGYKWVIEHYNIKRDGVFLGGRSMGGANTFNLIRRECPIPVIAACPNVPANASFGYSNEEATRKAFCAWAMGFDIPDGYEFKATSEMTQEELTAENQLLSDNWEKWIKCLPMLTMCVDIPSKETFMSYWERHDGSLYTYMKSLHARVKCPVKIFGCWEDKSCPPPTTSEVYYKMLINAGQIAELRLFHDSRYPGTTSTNAHHYEIQDDALKVDYVTRYGETYEDAPVVYVEMLKFWRRYEQE